jgi:hypothetical protein
LRPVLLSSAVGADGVPYTVERDTVLSYVTFQGPAFITTNPARTIANSVTAVPGGAVSDILAMVTTANIPFQQFIDYPLSAGEVLYVCYSSTNRWILMLFSDLVS